MKDSTATVLVRMTGLALVALACLALFFGCEAAAPPALHLQPVEGWGLEGPTVYMTGGEYFP